MESPHLKEMADQGVGKPDLVSPASVAPPVSSPMTTLRLPVEAPWERGREEDNPVTVVLAIHRTSGVELRRGPGRGGTWLGPTPAVERKPPESPPRERDVGAYPTRSSTLLSSQLCYEVW
jgi:hypothetical protein